MCMYFTLKYVITLHCSLHCSLFVCRFVKVDIYESGNSSTCFNYTATKLRIFFMLKDERINDNSLCLSSVYGWSSLCLRPTTGPILTHLVTTLGGSSGSPVFKVVKEGPVAVSVHAGAIPPPPREPVVNVSYLISDIVHHMLKGELKNG